MQLCKWCICCGGSRPSQPCGTGRRGGQLQEWTSATVLFLACTAAISCHLYWLRDNQGSGAGINLDTVDMMASQESRSAARRAIPALPSVSPDYQQQLQKYMPKRTGRVSLAGTRYGTGQDSDCIWTQRRNAVSNDKAAVPVGTSWSSAKVGLNVKGKVAVHRGAMTCMTRCGA
jgi:hypothetical protein